MIKMVELGIDVNKFSVAVVDTRSSSLNESNRVLTFLLLLVKGYLGNQYFTLGVKSDGSHTTA